MTRYYNPENDPFYTRFGSDADEDESGQAEIQIEDWELEKICANVAQMVRLATYAVRMEHEDVIIKRKKTNNQQSSGSAVSGLEYLGIKHLTDSKDSESSKFKIIWAGTPEAAGVNNKYDATAAVKVERVSSHQRYWWMLSNTNPNLETLLDEISEDTEKWHDRQLLIYIEIEQPSEKRFIRCDVLPAAAAAKAAAAK